MIRTIVVNGDDVFFSAGDAIVAQSDEEEFAETMVSGPANRKRSGSRQLSIWIS